VSQLQQQYRLTEFGRGISVFTRDSVKFRGNTEILRQRPNSAARGKLWALVISLCQLHFCVQGGAEKHAIDHYEL